MVEVATVGNEGPAKASNSVEERCARWLLMTHDRAGADQFNLTQEFLAVMLGVRRPSVTVVARTLHKAGLIDYAQQITILDARRWKPHRANATASSRHTLPASSPESGP